MILELCIIIIIFIIGLRGIIVCVVKSRAISALHSKNLQLVDAKKYKSMISFSRIDEKSFLKMCMMLNKWTVNQFYPFISNKE